MKTALTGKVDLGPDEFRGWRHPVTHQWHLLVWDGDDLDFMDGFFGGPVFLNNNDKVNHFTPLPANAEPESILPDQRPHEHLKFHPSYRTAFNTRLTELLKASSGNPNAPVVLSQANLLALFDAHAGEFRRTLECEVMRWGDHRTRRNFNFDTANYANNAINLPDAWEQQINYYRFDASPDARGIPFSPMLRTRLSVKTASRESRLLNDIRPPVITVSGNLATITRPAGGAGRIYFEIESYEKDPASFESFPAHSPQGSASVSRGIRASDRYVAARIYGLDLDGDPSWSALQILTVNQP